jgi:hypothetical protein
MFDGVGERKEADQLFFYFTVRLRARFRPDLDPRPTAVRANKLPTAIGPSAIHSRILPRTDRKMQNVRARAVAIASGGFGKATKGGGRRKYFAYTYNSHTHPIYFFLLLDTYEK